jgi:ABC-2 type transport system permease protein
VPEGSQRALVAHFLRAHLRVALAWSAAFAIVCASSITGYASAYPHAAERVRFAHSVERSGGLQAVFGLARRLDTLAGFVAWRTLAFLPLVAGIWGLLAVTRTLRGEEEDGRWEVLLGAPLSPGRATLLAVTGLVACAAIVCIGTAAALVLVGTLAYGMPLAGSLYLALALSLAAVVFIALGALAAELASSRRLAVAAGATAFGLAFVVRVAADSSPRLDWLRWITPLGWIEELRPLTGAQPLVLVPIAALCAGSVGLAVAMAGRRDLGTGLIRARAEARPRPLLLRSATAQALRGLRGGALGWAFGLGATGLFFGLIAKSVARVAATSGGLRRAAGHYGGVNVASAAGYLGLIFLFVVAAVCVYAANHAAHTREEEACGRLDALLAAPLTRASWLRGRLTVSLLCLTLATLSAALLCWAGAAVQSSGVGLDGMLEAALNALALGVLFLGLGTLAFGLAPRLTSPIALGLVAGTFLLEMVGSAVKAPRWLLEASPFHHLSLAPASALDWTGLAVMAAGGVAAALAGIFAFTRRDVVET